jgi:hypothetical protein
MCFFADHNWRMVLCPKVLSKRCESLRRDIYEYTCLPSCTETIGGVLLWTRIPAFNLIADTERFEEDPLCVFVLLLTLHSIQCIQLLMPLKMVKGSLLSKRELVISLRSQQKFPYYFGSLFAHRTISIGCLITPPFFT